MAKITLASILAAFASATSLNKRFRDIEDNFNDKVLYRDNPSGEPNQMISGLDMNSQRITNLPSPIADQEPARFIDIKNGVPTIVEVVPSAVGNEDKALSSSGTGLVYKRTAFSQPTIAAMTADASVVLGQLWECEDYAVGNGAGILTFKVVAAATGTDNGGSFIDHDTLSLQFQRIFISSVSVKDFGAVGDGTTDDTDVINAATSYLNSLGGGRLFIPDGIYIITDDTTFLEANKTGMRLFSNIDVRGQSRAKTILKMADNAVNGADVIRINGGPLIPWNTSRISNVSIRDLTVDGNRANHLKKTVTDGVTTASSTTVTSASAPFVAGDVGSFIFIDRNRSAFSITNVVASGSDTIITAIGHDFRVGEAVFIAGIVGSGDFTALNNNSFTITKVTSFINEQFQSFTITNTITTGSYTSGGTATGGKLGVTISTFVSPTEVTVSIAPTTTTTGNNFSIEKGQNGWGFSVLGADDVVLENVTSKNCWGDGFYIAEEFGGAALTQSKNINILNVDSDGNRRQGLSGVNVENLNIDNSYFRNTGIDGVGPGAGIDLEPNEGIVQYVNISNSFLIDNVGPGFTSSIIFTDTSGTPLVRGSADKYGTWDVNLINCQMLRNRNFGISNTGTNEGVGIHNCIIKFNRRGGIRLLGNATGKIQQQQKITNSIISWNQLFKGVGGAVDTDDSNNGHGILMSNSTTTIRISDILIQGNTIEYNDGHGIFSSGLVADHIWINNNISIKGNGQELDDTYSNIKIEGTQSLGLRIMNNKISKGATAANGHPYGISSGFVFSKIGIEVDTSSSNDSVISQNNVEDGGSTSNIVVTNMLNDTGGRRTYVFSNFGFKTDSTVFGASIDSETLGAQTQVISHTLDITPLQRHISVSVMDDIGGTPMATLPDFKIEPFISAISATTVTVKWEIATAGIGRFIVNVRILASVFD